jgi:hypothetical protein
MSSFIDSSNDCPPHWSLPVSRATTKPAKEGVFPARACGVVNERGRFAVTVVDYTNAESIYKERLKIGQPVPGGTT